MTDMPNRPRHDDPIEALIAPMRPILPDSKETKILLTVLFLLSLWGVAIATFGIPALVWPMKLIVPTAVVCLILLTAGK